MRIYFVGMEHYALKKKYGKYLSLPHQIKCDIFVNNILIKYIIWNNIYLDNKIPKDNKEIINIAKLISDNIPRVKLNIDVSEN